MGNRYIRSDGSHKDIAMKEAGDDWVRMTAGQQKRYERNQFVGDQARKYVKMKQASYVRQRRMEAVQSQREHKKEKTRREARQMPNTPPVEETAEEEFLSRITQLCGGRSMRSPRSTLTSNTP